jgi:hypothetical protein
VNLRPQALHLFLKSQLLSLQILQSVDIRGGMGHLFLDRAFEALVPGSQFAKASVDGHDPSGSVLHGNEVNTAADFLSDHIWLLGVTDGRGAAELGKG